MRTPSGILHVISCIALLTSACATAQQVAVPVAPPAVTWGQKLGWIVRLEDQRILRDPNPPPPAVIRAATQRQPAVIAPPAPSDLLRLLEDPEARTRRRAALAVGRVGLSAGVEPLMRLLTDADVEVRQMAAFALGLIGDAAARPALLNALKDPDPVMQGRAAEALGLIGDRADAPAVRAMVQAHVAAGAIAAVEPDDVSAPLAPAVEATRLGLYALVRLGSFDALAAAALTPEGQPVARWWPVAYALQRLPDPRATAALRALVETPGRYTASFAVRGLAAVKAADAVPALRQIVEQRRGHPAVVIQAVRALTALGDTSSAELFTKLVIEENADPALRLEAMTGFSTLAGADAADLLIELVSDRTPAIRAAALRTLARVDPDTFMATLAGIDPDRDWTVRSSIATALGGMDPERSLTLLTAMLDDPDQRVLPAVLAALAAAKAPGAEKVFLQRLLTGDFVARAAAATALADWKVVAAIPPLAQA